jgi:leucyl/phenylalanyl-tRNA--protein transferase
MGAAVPSAATVPIEPPPSRWQFPRPADTTPDGLLAVGADLEPGTLLAAYRMGAFPMPLDGGRVPGWWHPDPRGVIGLGDLRVSRSLRRSCRRYTVSSDRAFAAVLAGCADPSRAHGWISPAVEAAYTRLHTLGWAHSVEVWDADGTLAGGLYGVELGGLFAAESKFHVRPDASKVALVALVERLGRAGGERLLDVQWTTPHLVSLGARDVTRSEYLELLARALPSPPAFG